MTVQNELTTEAFWNNYWKNIKLPSTVNNASTFDRCLSERLTEKIKQVGVKGQVLEIGAAPGKWLAYLSEIGDFKPSGLDYSSAGIEAMKKNFKLLNITPEDFYVGDFFEIFPKEKYDVVMSFGFIEHFENPHQVIDRHLQWLKPGGVLVLGVPNFNSIHGVLQYFLKKSILRVHNLKIMNLKFFKELQKRFPVKTVSVEYLGSFEPSLPIAEEKKSVKTLLPRLVIKVLYHFRKFKFTDKINGPWISSYILAVYCKKHNG
jgi:2-polyprenyl-3-methyl-5-hydroxy-6-metoxy-1,4-benzoquinol methylase